MKLRNRSVLSGRTLTWLILAAFFLLLLPFLYLGRYDVPSADDFTFGAATHLTLVHGGGASAVLGAAFRHVADIYRNWQGSYAAVFLMSLQPAVFSEGLYGLTPWLMLGALFGGLFVLCICLLHSIFGLPRYTGAALAGLTGILYLLLVPYPVESLYWFNGGVYYTFFHGAAMLGIALAIRTALQGGIGRSLGLCLLAAFLAGGNLITGLSLSILWASAELLLLLEKKRVPACRLLLPGLVLLACFLVNVLAPGNAARQADQAHIPAVIPAILQSFRSGLLFSLRWARLPVLGGMLLLGILFWPVLPESRFSFRWPGLVSLWSYCFFSAMFCPTQYATGDPGPGRLLDIIYCSYLLLFSLNLFYWLGWLRRRHGGSVPAKGPGLIPVLGTLLLCLALLGVSAKLRGGINLASAFTTLHSGQAARYHQQAQERLAVLKDPFLSDVKLAPYPDPPYLLFFDDVTEDPEAWQNLAMAEYYEKDRVVLLPDTGE